MTCAALVELHEVRCCSNDAIGRWARRSGRAAPPKQTNNNWTQSNNFDDGYTACVNIKTFGHGEAEAFCSLVGGSLCM